MSNTMINRVARGDLATAWNNTDPYDTLCLGPGEFHTGEVLLNKPGKIFGAGIGMTKIIVDEGNGLVCSGAPDSDLQDGRLIMAYFDVVAGDQFEGRAKALSGIRIGPVSATRSPLQPTRVTLQDIRVHDFNSIERPLVPDMPALVGGAGILITQGQSITISQVYVRGCWRGLVEWSPGAVCGLWVGNSLFRSNKDDGVLLTNIRAGSFRDIVCENNDGNGFTARAPAGIPGGVIGLELENAYLESNQRDHGEGDLTFDMLGTAGENRNVRGRGVHLNSRQGKRPMFAAKMRESQLDVFEGGSGLLPIQCERNGYNDGTRHVIGLRLTTRDDGPAPILDAGTVWVRW